MKVSMMIMLCFLSLSAFAQQDKHFVEVSGSAICDSDCSVAALEAQDEARATATELCNPLDAIQVSVWKTKVVGFGRLTSSAIFSCENNEAH